MRHEWQLKGPAFVLIGLGGGRNHFCGKAVAKVVLLWPGRWGHFIFRSIWWRDGQRMPYPAEKNRLPRPAKYHPCPAPPRENSQNWGDWQGKNDGGTTEQILIWSMHWSRWSDDLQWMIKKGGWGRGRGNGAVSSRSFDLLNSVIYCNIDLGDLLIQNDWLNIGAIFIFRWSCLTWVITIWHLWNFVLCRCILALFCLQKFYWDFSFATPQKKKGSPVPPCWPPH